MPTDTVLSDERDLQWLESQSQNKTLDYAEVDEILRRVPALCAALRAENERLHKHIEDLNHDFESSNKFCDEHHVLGSED